MINKLNLQKTKFFKVILTAENGKEALDYFDNQMLLIENERVIPDLILLDLNMPVIDGWEFLEFFSEKFIELHKKVKIALLSSSVNPYDKIKVDSNSFDFTFIYKALGMDNLNNLKEHIKLKDYFNNQA